MVHHHLILCPKSTYFHGYVILGQISRFLWLHPHIFQNCLSPVLFLENSGCYYHSYNHLYDLGVITKWTKMKTSKTKCFNCKFRWLQYPYLFKTWEKIGHFFDYLFISQHPQYLARCSYNLPSVTSRSRLLACICISATERCAISDVNSVFLFFTTQVIIRMQKQIITSIDCFFCFFVLTGKVSSFSPEPLLAFQCKRTNPAVIKSNEGTHSDRK